MVLVGLNVHNLAKKLDKAYQKNPDKLKKFWESAGGRINNLVKKINKGKTKRRILGDEELPGMIGVVQTVPALLTAAAPLLAKVAKLLKSIGIDPAELVDVAKNAINNKAKEVFANTLAPRAAQEQQYADEAQ